MIVAALAPDFALIALGALLATRFDESVWRGLERLSYLVLYPALIFHAAASRPVAIADVLSIGGAAVAVLATGLVLGLLTRPLGDDDPIEFGAALQNAYRFNTALAFVAIGVLPAQAASVLAILVGCAIPLANVFAVVGLTRGRSISARRVVGDLVTNPFLLASLGGLVFALTGKTLAPPVGAFVARLADAAVPLVLLAIGAALRGAPLWPLRRQALALHTIRLLILPALVLACALVFDLRGTSIATVLLFAALPTATAAHVLATRYGANRAAAALLVTQSCLFGLFTLPIWALVAVWLT